MLLVGHGAVRARVMGREAQRAATSDEVAAMRVLVRQALDEGAVGMSAGLEYEPGRWSTTAELVELARELVPRQGVYISHERSEGSDPLWYVPSQHGPGPPTLLDAVRETIEIGERTGARVVASHLKAKGANYWGSSAAAVGLIERARARGVDVWADQYPYPTSGTDGSTVLIPNWAVRSAGGRQAGPGARATALRETLGDPSRAGELRSDIAHEIARRSRGTPRIANRLLRRVRDYAQVRADGRVTTEVAEAAMKLLEVDQHGFDDVDRRLMLTIIEKFGGGPVGLSSIAAATSEEPDAIEDMHEPFLIQIGFLERTPRGRVATRRAYEYFGRPAPGRGLF